MWDHHVLQLVDFCHANDILMTLPLSWCHIIFFFVESGLFAKLFHFSWSKRLLEYYLASVIWKKINENISFGFHNIYS
jgi:hypothetical protein